MIIQYHNTSAKHPHNNHHQKLANSTSSTNMYLRDWRKGLSNPPTYRIGKTTFRFHIHFALVAICAISLVLLFLYVKPDSYSDRLWLTKGNGNAIEAYNYTYPLSPAIHINGDVVSYRIGLIADLDQRSRKSDAADTWCSYYKRGHLTYNAQQRSVSVTFDVGEPIELSHHYALKGRGMELSELVTFNGRLLTVDDRTGFVYELSSAAADHRVYPWVVLMDGNGRSTKGFKAEWATMKDEALYVGSMGKEWTSATGEFVSTDPMYVKVVAVTGHVHHLNWSDNYKKLRSAIGIEWPGYMIHESGLWSQVHRKWFFLPRRCSKEKCG